MRSRHLLLVAMGALGVAGCDSSGKSTGAATVVPTPVLHVVQPQRKAIPRPIDQPGWIQPYEEAPLFAKLAGYVAAVRADIGDHVRGPRWLSWWNYHPGDVLAVVAIPELEDELNEKLAGLAKAQAELEQASKQQDVAEASHGATAALVGTAKAGLKGAQATFERWELETKRVDKMVREKTVEAQIGDETRRQLAVADAARDEAQARVTAAEKMVTRAQAEWDKAKADVRAAEAKRNLAEAEVARMRTLLHYRFIRAPFDGTVTRRKVDMGHFVQPAGGTKGEPLFVLSRLDMVRAIVRVPETEAVLVRKGVKARISIPVLKGGVYEGQVTRTAEALDPESRTLRIEIDLVNPEGIMRAGQFINARLIAPMPEAWVLPATTIVKQADIMVCFMHHDGKAVRVPIQTGRTDGESTEVFKKRKTGSTSEWEDWTGSERVLSGPTSGLTDGQKVSIK